MQLLWSVGSGSGGGAGGAKLLGAVVVAAVAVCMAPPSVGIGVELSAQAQEGKRRRVPHMQEATYRRISEVQDLVDAEQYDEAFEKLTSMLESRRYNKNEIAQVHRAIAYIYLEKDNIDKAAEHFEQVLAQMPDISEAMENATLDALSRLYFNQAMILEGEAAKPLFHKSLATIREWMSKVDDPGPVPYHFMASVHFQLGDTEKSLQNMETAVELTLARGDVVKESWWSLLQALHTEQRNWERVAEISEVLVRDYPKRSYWITLASAYGQMNQEQKQLWTLEAAHAGGYLETSSDFSYYGGVLLQNDLPNRAAKQLQAGLDDNLLEHTARNLQLLGQAYQIGKDFDAAIPVFEEAGELAEDGETLARLASLYAMRGEAKECRDTARKSIDKGGVARPLGVKITLGACLFELHQFRAAQRIFSEVRADARKMQDRATEARIAGQWIKYIDSESKRLEELAKMDR